MFLELRFSDKDKSPAPTQVAHADHLKKATPRFLASNARRPLAAWRRVVNDKQLAWTGFHDVKRTYASASLVGECVVFNIGGNKYRLITKINYRSHNVFIRAILSHDEYDQGLWKKDCGCES